MVHVYSNGDGSTIEEEKRREQFTLQKLQSCQ